MRLLLFLFFLIVTISCKNKKDAEIPASQNKPEVSTPDHPEIQNMITDTVAVFSEENLELDREKTKPIKRQRLIQAEDDKVQLEKLVISKSFYKEEDLYILDYKYPYLNENLDPGYANFNDFMTENYLNIEATENEILEDKFIYCDSLGVAKCMDKRVIDYKIYSVNDQMISVLLYKENYYAGMKNSTYMFESLNFDLRKYMFNYFKDFFIPGSEKELFTIINETIREGINNGDLYMDCWELSQGDFQVYKNNFVINDDVVEFYFDDCIICPSYTGTYSIEIPIKKIMHLIKKYNDEPLIS